MRQADIDILVQEGEGTTLEFKEALSRSFVREVVALANTIGGRILLGVRDDGAVVGITSRPRVSFGSTCRPARDSAIPRTLTQTSIVPGSGSLASAVHQTSRTCWSTPTPLNM